LLVTQVFNYLVYIFVFNRHHLGCHIDASVITQLHRGCQRKYRLKNKRAGTGYFNIWLGDGRNIFGFHQLKASLRQEVI